MKRVAIYDLDGTVICSLHRYRAVNGKIDLPHWIENSTHEKIMRDKLLPLADNYKSDLQCPKTFVIIATARTCIPGDSNYQFVTEFLGYPDLFIHRTPENQYIKGAFLKLNGILPELEKIGISTIKEAKVFEDNLTNLFEIVRQLQIAGIPAIGHYIPSEQGH